MERNEQWNREMEKRIQTYFGYLDEQYMTREIYEWNVKFMDEYHRLNDWTSEDGTMQYCRDHVEKMMGIPETYGYHFISHVRKQMMAYKERTLKAMHEAGKTPSEIAAELSFGNHIVTEKTVERMIERLFG